MSSLYNSDFYAWSLKQAELLRERQWDLLDIENIAEEIESLARSDRRELRNRLGVLTAHLLKWEYQPEKRSRSWEMTLVEQRLQIQNLLEDSPSLGVLFDALLQQGYRYALLQAERETCLPRETFPTQCPYTPGEVLDSRFYPG
ncbi:DUF29 domain-containing protein [Gloeobacter morelensis]|uniref:DUF29 domain-containing protein n=1 Tax=Gloeobacter morelensis MG652769 TaxID=2781736 RepID=A0ABY3PGU5_9CYAN|nr:DUF29 domain-containing protein [Gloeobacter morelensis]UFP92880.1 DUF29 domain-containing protein [Gloeobacter morelensis MG652769]